MKVINNPTTINQIKAITPIVAEIEKSLKKDWKHDRLTGLCVKDGVAFTTNGYILVSFNTDEIDDGRYTILADNILNENDNGASMVNGKGIVAHGYKESHFLDLSEVKSANRPIQALGIIMRATDKYFDWEVFKIASTLFKANKTFTLSMEEGIDPVKIEFDNGITVIVMPVRED